MELWQIAIPVEDAADGGRVLRLVRKLRVPLNPCAGDPRFEVDASGRRQLLVLARRRYPPRRDARAPRFEAHGVLTCLLQAIVFGATIIARALYAWIPSVLCTMRQLAFRIRHCREGNPDPCRRL